MASIELRCQHWLLVMFATSIGQGLSMPYEMQRGVKMSWAAARDHCADLEKSLPVIKDSTTSFAFEAAIKGSWLGASDTGVKGVFRWTDNTLLNWTHWAKHQPEWMVGESMCMYAGKNNLWTSSRCTELQTFACQSPAVALFCNTTDSECDLDGNNDIEEWTDSCYKVSPEPVSWSIASLACQQTGRLMTLKTMSSNSRLGFNDSDTRYWIGLSSTQTTGVYRWEDGTPLRNDTQWLFGGPTGSSRRQCVYMVVNNNREMYTNEDCDLQLPFICEFQGGPLGTALCGRTPVVDNGTFTGVTAWATLTTFLPGTEATYSCDVGHYFSPQVAKWTIKCMACGQWSSIPQTCQAADCHAPPDVSQAGVSLTSTLFGSEATYTCLVGFRFNLSDADDIERTIECDAHGNWTTNTATRCEPVDCGAPVYIPHTRVSNGSTTYLQAATYQCVEGRRFSSTADPHHVITFICDERQQWLGINISCEVTDCGRPYFVRNSILLSNSGTEYGHTAKYICRPGFFSSNGSDVLMSTCEAFGNWTTLDETCQEEEYNSSSSFTTTISDGNNNGGSDNSSNNTTPISAETSPSTSMLPPTSLTSRTTVGQSAAIPSVTAEDEVGRTTPCLTGQSERYASTDPVSQVDDQTTEYTSDAATLHTTIHSPTLKPSTGTSSRLCGTTALPRPFWGSMLWIHNGRRVGNAAEFTCHPGSVFVEGGSSRSVICMQDGQWHSQVSVCKTLLCPPVPSANGATNNDKQHVSVGNVVTYTCQPGLLFPDGTNTAQIQCNSNGQWYPDLSGCRVRCSPLAYFDKSVSGPYSGVIGTSVTFRCRRGHRYRDGTTETTIHCQESREWEETEDCKVERCPALVPLHNGAINTTVAIFGTIVEVMCDVGYKIKGNATRRILLECLENRSWNSSIPVCEEVFCGVLPPVDLSSRSGDGTGYNAVVEVTCDRDHRFQDGAQSKSVTCTDTAVWSEVGMSCATDRCPPLPQLPMTLEIHPIADKLATVIYSCLPGSLFPSGERELSTQCNGINWDNPPRTGCAVIRCPRLSTLDKATVNSTEMVYDSVVNIKCDPGYTFKTGNTFTTRCNEFAQWSGMPQKCKRLDCGSPPTIPYSSIPANTDNRYVSTVTVLCFLGYWFQPGVFSRDVTCTAEGQWIPPLNNSNCHVVTCTAWATWDGVIVNDANHRQTGDVVNVSCAADKMFPDSEPYKTTTCSPLGEWEPPVPDCVYRVSPPRFDPKLKEAKRSRLIGTLAVSLVGILLIAMVIVDVVTLIYGHGDWRTKRRQDCHKPVGIESVKPRFNWGFK